MVPVSTVDKPHFKDFVNELEPSYTIPTAKTVTSRLQTLHKDERDKLRQEVGVFPDVAITHDSWTSLATENYETVTCHFISKSPEDVAWVMNARVLQTTKIEGPHNAQAIADFLTTVKQQWNLGDITAVTDNASVEIKAFQLLEWNRLGCIGHIINLVIRDALKDPVLSKLVAKGRNLVGYFHKSPLATGFLDEKQRLLSKDENPQTYRLINDVATRWNSTYEMLLRISELTGALHAVLVDPDIKLKDYRKSLFKENEQRLVQLLVEVLKPFKIATELLSSESTPTLSLVFPTLEKIYAAFGVFSREFDGDSDASDSDEKQEVNTGKKQLSKTIQLMKDNLTRRVEPYMDSYEMAAILDPRTKGLVVNKKPSVKDRLVCAVQELIQHPTARVQIKSEPQETGMPAGAGLPVLPHLPGMDSQTLPEVQPPPSKKIKTEATQGSDMDDWLDDILITNVEEPDDAKAARNEVERYLSDGFEKGEAVLSWWGQREAVYPRVSQLARKYLAIPASSVPSERVFSLAGNIVSKKRAALSAENVDMFIFLKKNLK